MQFNSAAHNEYVRHHFKNRFECLAPDGMIDENYCNCILYRNFAQKKKPKSCLILLSTSYWQIQWPKRIYDFHNWVAKLIDYKVSIIYRQFIDCINKLCCATQWYYYYFVVVGEEIGKIGRDRFVCNRKQKKKNKITNEHLHLIYIYFSFLLCFYFNVAFYAFYLCVLIT